jgi:hypothetical protein
MAEVRSETRSAIQVCKHEGAHIRFQEAELCVLESRAERAGLTLSEWIRDVLLGSSVDAGTMAAERGILAEMLAMRAILLNFMLKLSMRQPITEQVSRELIEWADSNKMKRALEVLAKNSTREERMQTAQPEPELPKAATKSVVAEELGDFVVETRGDGGLRVSRGEADGLADADLDAAGAEPTAALRFQFS